MTADNLSPFVPRLRFPEFHNNGDWGSTKLGQVCRIATGKKDANEGCIPRRTISILYVR